jgi:hypothetical protein
MRLGRGEKDQNFTLHISLFKNFTAFYGTRRFITVLTRALH